MNRRIIKILFSTFCVFTLIFAYMDYVFESKKRLPYYCEKNKIETISQSKKFFLDKLQPEIRDILENSLYIYTEASLETKMLGWSIYKRPISFLFNEDKYVWTVTYSYEDKNKKHFDELMQFSSCGYVFQDFDTTLGVQILGKLK